MSTLSDLDDALARAARRPRFLVGTEPAPTPETQARLAANFAAIDAEIDAPRPRWLERVLLRFGVDEATVPLVTATPALRRSFFGAVILGVLFALSAASTSTAEGTERIVGFLIIAPLVPLAGVALCFGPKVDPTHEIAVAAPMDGFRLFLVRALTVVGASTVILGVGSILVPAGGAHRVAWLLPALAATTFTMALSTRFDPRFAAGFVAAAWIVGMTIAVGAADASAVFGPALQIPSLIVAVLGAAAFGAQRRRLDTLSSR